MPWKYYVAQMPGSAINTDWLNSVGSNVSHSFTGAPTGSWNLVNIIPMSPVNASGSGALMCYFISGSY